MKTFDPATMEVLKSLVVHTAAITGEKSSAVDVVRAALPGHPKDRVLSSPRALEALLRDIGARAESVRGCPGNVPGLGGHFSALRFDEKSCLSLRVNFGLGYDSIGRVLGMPAEDAERINDAAMAGIAEASGVDLERRAAVFE